MICAEVSIYPLKTSNASSVITSSIDALGGKGVDYKVGSISTHIHGNPQQVWESLRTMFDQAKSQGEVSMVVTITNAAD